MSQPRPPAKPVSRIHSFGDFTLDLDRACLLRDGSEVRLRPKSYEALTYLVDNPGRVVTKAELIQAVWPNAFVTDDSLVQCMHDIRRALGDDSQQFIKTVPRRGYIFEAAVNPGSNPDSQTIYSERLEGVRVVIERETEITDDQIEPREALAGLAAKPAWFGNWKVPAITLLVILAGAAVLIAMRRNASEPPASAKSLSEVRSIAVLPFKSLNGDENDKYLGLGLADT